jgi:hypothetical protein
LGQAAEYIIARERERAADISRGAALRRSSEHCDEPNARDDPNADSQAPARPRRLHAGHLALFLVKSGISNQAAETTRASAAFASGCDRTAYSR